MLVMRTMLAEIARGMAARTRVARTPTGRHVRAAYATPSEASAAIARRVAAARARQSRRYAALPPAQRVRTNAEADGVLLDEIATPEPAGLALLQRAAERLRLSARGYHRVLRVARTLADLEGAAAVARHHIAEALSYRMPLNVSAGAGSG